MSPYQKILCPIDGSLTSERGMREATRAVLLVRDSKARAKQGIG